MKNKKADAKMIGGQIIKLILGAAVVLVLVLLIYSLISPLFDKEKETAKSYLEIFNRAIHEADENGKSNFNMWGGEPKMVYFGDKKVLSSGHDFFSRSNDDKNYLCFCYEPEDKIWKCNYCASLNYPIVFKREGNPTEIKVFEEFWEFEITKDDVQAVYVFDGVNRRPEE